MKNDTAMENIYCFKEIFSLNTKKHRRKL